jgi:hypothetical protein
MTMTMMGTVTIVMDERKRQLPAFGYLPVLAGALPSMREVVTLLARHCRGSTVLNPLMNVIDAVIVARRRRGEKPPTPSGIPGIVTGSCSRRWRPTKL